MRVIQSLNKRGEHNLRDVLLHIKISILILVT